MVASSVKSAGIADSGVSALANRLGFWASILMVVFTLAMAVTGIMTPAKGGPLAAPGAAIPYPYTAVGAFYPGEYLWMYPGILLAVTFVVLMACIHSIAPGERKLLSRIGLGFALLYAVVIILDYFLQLAVVGPSLAIGETDGLAAFSMYNPQGIMIALEDLGYSLMCFALLFTAFSLVGGKREMAVRWLFIAGAVMAVIAAAMVTLLYPNLILFEVIILTVVWIVLIPSGVLLSVKFGSRSS